MTGTKLGTFTIHPQLFNELLDMELNSTQRWLAITMYMIAEPNGVLSKNPMALKRQAGDGTLADVHLVYEALSNAGLLEFFSHIRTNEDREIVDEYIYLTDYLNHQKFWSKAKLPSPPWVKYKPMTKDNGQYDPSRGRYYDTRQECNLLLDNTDKDNIFDKNPQTELKGKELNIERKGIEKKESAIALNDNKKTKDIDKPKTPYERIELALKEVLDGKNGIRDNLTGDLSTQKDQIRFMMNGSSLTLGINDILSDFDIEYTGNDWKPYQKQDLLVNQSIR